jgi:hypothetical protein
MEIIQKQTQLDIYVFILNYVFVDFAKPPNDEYILFNTIIYANIIQLVHVLAWDMQQKCDGVNPVSGTPTLPFW